MQIHELTKRRRTDEGILDGIKDAFSAAKSGFDAGRYGPKPEQKKTTTDEGLLDNIKAGINAAKEVGSTAYNAAKPAIAGAKAVGQSVTSPTFGAVARDQGYLNAAEKSRQAINKKYGLNIQGAKRLPGELIAGSSTANQQPAAQQNNIQQQVQTMTQNFVNSKEFPDLTQVLPDKGQMLKVLNPANKGDYFKDENGIWYADSESPSVPPKPVAQNQIKTLDDLVNADKYTQVPSIIKSVAPAVTPAPTKGAKKATTAAAQTTTQPATPSVTPATQSSNPVVQEATGAFNRRQLAIKAAKELVAKDVVLLATKNKINPKQALDAPEAQKAFAQIAQIAQAPVSKIKTSKDKKQRLKKAFAQYATAALAGAEGESAQAATAGEQPALVANPQEKALAVQTISRVTGQDGAKIAQAAETNPQVKQALATITKESIKIFEDNKNIEPSDRANGQNPVAVIYNGQQYSFRNALPGQTFADHGDPKWYEWIPSWWNDKFTEISPELNLKLNRLVQTLPNLKKVAEKQDKMVEQYIKWEERQQELIAQQNVSSQRASQYAAQHRNDPNWYRNQQMDIDNSISNDLTQKIQTARALGHHSYANQLQTALKGQTAKKYESLEEKLNRELLLLNESQVFITKDIVVKTSKGNYVKSHLDQQWRDPNGTIIDQDKYADYIAKLDATPAAQTRYQADSKNAHGSDKAVMNPSIKLQPAEPKAAEPDPIQQMADQEKMRTIMRNRDVQGLNAMVQDTFNQLQNAKIFQTGQEDYLKDRLAALMAMKA